MIIKFVISYPVTYIDAENNDIVEPSYFNMFAQPLNSDDRELTSYPDTVEPEYFNIYAEPVIQKDKEDDSVNSISIKRKTREVPDQQLTYLRSNNIRNEYVEPSYFNMYAQPIKTKYYYQSQPALQPIYNPYTYPEPINTNRDYIIPNNQQPFYNY